MRASDIAKDLDLNEGGEKRQDCPECGGTNTFYVSLRQGTKRWVCFRNSCGVRGLAKAERTYASIKDALTPDTDTSVRVFTPPDYITSVLSSEDAMDYLERMNSMEAYTKGDVDIRFDPKARRVLFMVYSKGNLVDAAGRALDKERTPKWYRYAGSGHPLVVGKSDLAVLVEDAPSACSVSRVATGVSLLGTSVQHSHLAILRSFNECIVALDKDASRKSLEIQKHLTYYVDAKVRTLEDDLKYLSTNEVREVLKL